MSGCVFSTMFLSGARFLQRGIPRQEIFGGSSFMRMLENIREIFVRIQPVARRCDQERIPNCACFCSFHGIGEQPLLSTHHKRSDRVFRTVVGYGDGGIFQKCVHRLLLPQSIGSGLTQFRPSRRVECLNPCVKCIENRL